MSVLPCAGGLDGGAAGAQSGLRLAMGHAAVNTPQMEAQVPAAQAPVLHAADATQQQVSTSGPQAKVAVLTACP